MSTAPATQSAVPSVETALRMLLALSASESAVDVSMSPLLSITATVRGTLLDAAPVTPAVPTVVS